MRYLPLVSALLAALISGCGGSSSGFVVAENRVVTSVRGPGGGYRLSRDSEEIDVAAVIAATGMMLLVVSKRSADSDRTQESANETIAEVV